jgi:carbonic anhydrase
MQYAAVHLHTPLFVVLGHEGCGAVAAALAALRGGPTEREHIELLLDRIEPGLTGVDTSLPADVQLATAVEANVRWALKQIRDTPEGQARMREGILRLEGAVYELETGHVRFLP